MMGGVPYYLSLLDKTQGVEANVDRLFFAERGELKREYDRLYSSLFRNSEIYMRVIETLAKCKQGMTRKEISTHLNLKSGGTLTKVLRELINCDFVRGYNTREKKIKQKDQIYQLTDLYTLFYMSFCHPGTTDVAYWTHQMGKPRQNTWYGLAFERICMLHIPQIKKSLGIEQIYTEYYSWRSKCSTPAAQIDLLIERADHLINLCEIKYSQSPYSIINKILISTTMEYNFREIEKKWQKRWVENKTYQVTEDETKKKFYVLNMFPYPSGAGLHVGHPLGYIASDIYARYKRLQGFNVLNPMGYDAYGLPAEQYAIQTGQHPAITTVNNINRYREQFDKIGFSFDWNREIRTCDPKYYHWTQWAFQKMFNASSATMPKGTAHRETHQAFEEKGSQGLERGSERAADFTAEEWKATTT